MKKQETVEKPSRDKKPYDWFLPNKCCFPLKMMWGGNGPWP